MLFKNAYVLRLSGAFDHGQESLQEALSKHPFTAPLPSQEHSRGWVDPMDEESDDLVSSVGNAHLMTLKVAKKILPSSVVREELKQRIAERGMRAVTKKERERMIDEIRADLLPKAFVQHKIIQGYYDAERQEIIVGSATNAQIEEFTGALRSTLNSLSLNFLKTSFAPGYRMTNWLRERNPPKKTQFGYEVTLFDPEAGCKGTFNGQDLHSDEIQECLDNGKKVKKLSLRWNDYISFSLDENLAIRKIKPLDSFTDQHESGDVDGMDSMTNFYFTLTALRELLPRIYEWFEVEDEGAKDAEDFEMTEEAGIQSMISMSDADMDHDYPLADLPEHSFEQVA